MPTITLHNIRYELRWFGEELWLWDGEDGDQVGRIERSEDGQRWLLVMGPCVLVESVDETAARRMVEKLAVRLAEMVAELDII